MSKNNRTLHNLATNNTNKKTTGRLRRSTKVMALIGLLLGAGMAFFATPGDAAAASGVCAAATTDLGVDTISVNVPAAATYTIWTRMKAPDTTHNTINLQVDNTDCFAVGGGSFTATAWNADSSNWIKYAGGVTSNVASVTLSAGTHSLKYVGTQAGVEVDRVILSSDASCTPTGTGDNCQSGDSTGPTVALQAPTANQQVTGTLALTATASDASGIAQVKFLVDGTVVNTDTASPYSYSWNSAGVTNASHVVTAQATDNAGNTSTSASVTIIVNNTVACSGTPTVPTNLQVVTPTANSLNLTWTASTPATGCTLQGYKIFRNGTLITTATGTSFSDTGLAPSTTYSYTIAAVDTSAHTSAQTAAVSGATSGDTVAPTVPTTLRSTLVASNSIAIAWNASTDNTGVASYVIFRNGTQVGTSTTTAFTDNALTPSTAYSYTVKAKDVAGNTSAASVALSVTTLTGSSANTGDLNNDGKVTLTDLSILLSHWNATGVPVTQGDVNADGKVNLTDLSILLSHWG